MNTHSMDAAPPAIVETSVVTPVFVDGLASVEFDRHGIGRLALYTEQRTSGSADLEHVLSARLLIPREALVSIAERILAAASSGGDVRPSAATIRGLN